MPSYTKVVKGTKLTKNKSGALRYSDDAKGRQDLLQLWAIRRLSVHLGNGAKIYGPRNWESGMSQSRFWRSAFRHLCDYLMGDRSEDHLAAAMWNVACMIHQEEMFERGRLDPSFMDLPEEILSYKKPKKVASKTKKKVARKTKKKVTKKAIKRK